MTGAVLRIQGSDLDDDDKLHETNLGDGWIASVHPEDRDQAVRIWRECVANRVAMDTENRVADHTGVYRWKNVRAAPVSGLMARL